MDNKTVIKYWEYLFSGIFFTGIFIFFAFFYNSHLHFEEQFQLFLLTDDFLISKLSHPGGLSGYIGSFLTQFYYLSLAGPVIITGLLFALQQVMKGILSKVNPAKTLFPVSFLPSLLSALILCNEFYPLSALTGFLLAMITGLIYVRIKIYKFRFFAGLVMIPAVYWLAGGSFLSLLILMFVYEILTYLKSREAGPHSFRVWYLIAYLAIGALVPFLVKQFLILQPVMMTFMSEFYYNILTGIPTAVLVLFILPPLLILLVNNISVKEKKVKFVLPLQITLLLLLCFFGLSLANFEAEEVMTYDFLTRNENWEEVLKFAERKPPRNYLSLAMLNLSLAKTGQMGNRMFNYDQHGINGLFLPFNKEYVAPVMGNEVFYHLGLTNASQEYAFESMETIPSMGKSARLIKRLAETNLINGQYNVSEKYLKLLEKTIFYRKWAKEALTYLGDEEKINNDPDWGEKRRFMVKSDYFFHVRNMEASLNRMVKEHPDNKIAFEYLMAFYMINKDLRNFMNCIPSMEKINYKAVPVSYQEAILYIIGLTESDPFAKSPGYISDGTKSKMKAYADIYTSYPDAKERLKKNFEGTYWYYLHFGELEKSEEEK